MAFWGKKEWETRGKNEGVVEPWQESLVEEAGYRLAVGSEYYTNTQDGGEVVQLGRNDRIKVAPGQFVFILTEEYVRIPRDAIGFISARASIKFRGLVNVSGFQVDPGYSGKLIFAMFNAGPQHIHLKRGEQIFSVWIADLVSAVDESFDGTDNIPNGLDEIPSKIINGISNRALTAYQVNETLQSYQKEMEEMRATLHHLKIAAVLALGVLLFALSGIVKDNISELFNAESIEPTELTKSDGAE